MRKAELIMAIVLSVLSLSIMYKSTELPIGWIRGVGPGGGAFSFWLGAGMLLSCIAIIVRWYFHADEPSDDPNPYMTPHTVRLFILVGGSLTAMIGLVHIVGLYGAVPLFLIFYLRVMGGYGWKTIASFATITPIITFFFFEIALNITLPKGYTEPLFYPIFDIFM